MIEPASTPSSSPQRPDDQQVSRAIRFALVCLFVGFSFFSIRASLSISHFEGIFQDMLGNRPLPALTSFVLRARLLFLAISIFIPLAAVATLFSKRIVASFYLIGTLIVVGTLHLIVLYLGLSAPLTSIITSLSGGSSPAHLEP